MRSNPVDDGDAFARAGNWVEAVAVWDQALDSEERKAATQRIRWFLDEAEGTSFLAASAASRREDRARMLVAGIVCAILGTVCVFLGQEQTGSVRNLLAAIAWLGYIAAAALVVGYAFGSGGPSRQGATSLTAADRKRARDFAFALTPGEHPHHPPI